MDVTKHFSGVLSTCLAKEGGILSRNKVISYKKSRRVVRGYWRFSSFSISTLKILTIKILLVSLSSCDQTLPHKHHHRTRVRLQWHFKFAKSFPVLNLHMCKVICMAMCQNSHTILKRGQNFCDVTCGQV